MAMSKDPSFQQSATHNLRAALNGSEVFSTKLEAARSNFVMMGPWQPWLSTILDMPFGSAARTMRRSHQSWSSANIYVKATDILLPARVQLYSFTLLRLCKDVRAFLFSTVDSSIGFPSILPSWTAPEITGASGRIAGAPPNQPESVRVCGRLTTKRTRTR